MREKGVYSPNESMSELPLLSPSLRHDRFPFVLIQGDEKTDRTTGVNDERQTGSASSLFGGLRLLFSYSPFLPPSLIIIHPNPQIPLPLPPTTTSQERQHKTGCIDSGRSNQNIIIRTRFTSFVSSTSPSEGRHNRCVLVFSLSFSSPPPFFPGSLSIPFLSPRSKLFPFPPKSRQPPTHRTDRLHRAKSLAKHAFVSHPSMMMPVGVYACFPFPFPLKPAPSLQRAYPFPSMNGCEK